MRHGAQNAPRPRSGETLARHAREGRNHRRRAETGGEAQFLGVEPAGGDPWPTHWRGLTMFPGGTPANFLVRRNGGERGLIRAGRPTQDASVKLVASMARGID